MSDIERDIEDLERIEEINLKKASMLANLLDEQMNQQDRFLASFVPIWEPPARATAGQHIYLLGSPRTP